MKRAATDWGRVRDRMRASEAALERALAPTQDRIREVFRRRAVLLAVAQEQFKPAATRVPVLICQVAQGRYAIEAKDVAEVLPLDRCAPVPGAPRNILGVINLRGIVRAVVDLGRLLGSEEIESGGGADDRFSVVCRDSGFVLMLRNKGRVVGGGEIGLRVDRIDALLEVIPQEWTHAGSGTFGKGLVSGNLMLIDIEKVLEGIVSTKESLTT